MIRYLAEKEIARTGKSDALTKRRIYGKTCGIAGIFLNLFLSALKIAAGMIAKSLSVVADGFNNLSDVLSSAASLIGFRLSERKPDKEHPYGHGRYEYIAAVAVTIMILLFGWELGKSAYEKLIHPAFTEWNIWTMAALGISLAVKGYMASYNYVYGKKFESDALLAVAKDSRNDIIATSGIVLTLILERVVKIRPDGVISLLIALFILYSGIRSLKETLDPLIGESPSEEFVGKVREIVSGEKEILGMHDLSVHDYGPGNVMISLHAEVDASKNFAEVHELIDRIEKELKEKLGAEATIHADPVVIDDPVRTEYEKKIRNLLEKEYPGTSFHDLRIRKEAGKTEVEFDLVIPYEEKTPDETIREEIAAKLAEKDVRVLIDVDKSEYR
ncbi:MAG: cation transporter [Erysipelotrichales bacterium]|nr:cation transporter [Erysipelotrichales bacterium]